MSFHTMQTAGGAVFTPLCIEDVIARIREDMGDEVANVIGEYIDDREGGEIYEEMKFNSDYNAMEGEVEGYHDALSEVQESIEQVMSYIENKQRINRDKVYIMLENIDDKIQKIL